MNQAPEWMRELAAAAAAIDVPRVMRPPTSGGRRSAVLILFGTGPDGPDLLFIQRSEGLPRVPSQPLAARDEQQVRSVRPGAEEDQHGGPPAA